MSLLLELPNELLWCVFDHLSNADVDTLHAIAEVRHRIKGQFCLVTDKKKQRRFKRIEPVFDIGDPQLQEKWKGRARVVLEVHNLPKTVGKIEKMLSPGLNMYISVFDTDADSWFHDLNCSDLSTLVELMNQDSGIKFISVEEADEFTLEAVTVRSDRFAAPKLERLTSSGVHLELCEGASRMLFPKLQEILIEEEYACFHECLDWSRMRVLRLEHVVDNYRVSGEGQFAPLLTELTIKGTHCGEILNLSLPNLKYFVIHQTAHDLLISDVELPSLVSMVVLTSFAVSMVRLNAPEILLFALHSSEVLKIQDVTMPLQENTHFSFDRMPDCDSEDIDFSFLQNLREFTVETHNSELLRFTPQLEGLSIMTETFSQDSYDLPKLKTIRLEQHSVEVSSLVPFKDIALENLHMQNLDTSVEDVETIAHWWGKSLKNVDIRHYLDMEIENWRFPQLETLTLSTGPSFEGLIGCSFPNLRVLTAVQEETFARRPTDSRWNVDAPELTKIRLVGYRIPFLNLIPYEKLEEVEINTVVTILRHDSKKFELYKVNEK